MEFGFGAEGRATTSSGLSLAISAISAHAGDESEGKSAWCERCSAGAEASNTQSRNLALHRIRPTGPAGRSSEAGRAAGRAADPGRAGRRLAASAKSRDGRRGAVRIASGPGRAWGGHGRPARAQAVLRAVPRTAPLVGLTAAVRYSWQRCLPPRPAFARRRGGRSAGVGSTSTNVTLPALQPVGFDSLVRRVSCSRPSHVWAVELFVPQPCQLLRANSTHSSPRLPLGTAYSVRLARIITGVLPSRESGRISIHISPTAGRVHWPLCPSYTEGLDHGWVTDQGQDWLPDMQVWKKNGHSSPTWQPC